MARKATAKPVTTNPLTPTLRYLEKAHGRKALLAAIREWKKGAKA